MSLETDNKNCEEIANMECSVSEDVYIPIIEDKMEACMLCSKAYNELTDTHLWKEHQISEEEYWHKVSHKHPDITGGVRGQYNVIFECTRCGAEMTSDQNVKSELCKKCTQKSKSSNNEKIFMGIPKIEKGMILMLEGLKDAYGLDLKDVNFKDTPKRVARAYAEIFEGIGCEKTIQDEILDVSFPSEYDGMVIASGMTCYSMCPHHFLPVEYVVDLVYIPDEKNLGLSKLARVVEMLSKQPAMQETFTHKIVELMNYIKPKGVYTKVRGKHFCMAMRGIKQANAWTYTSERSGVFKIDNDLVKEAMALISENHLQ